jgi:hypothetical protein
MKKRILALGCMAALLAFGSEAQAETANADAVAKIVTALTITNANKGLSFGTMVPGGGGHVTVAADGTAKFDGPTQINAGTSPTRAAQFSVSGGASCICDIDAEQSVELVGDAGQGSMKAELTESATSLTLDPKGNGTFSVGGVLEVPSEQKSGIYAGTFNVTVVYQ